MSGIAIIINNADFSSKGYGMVSEKGVTVQVTSISISGNNETVGSGQYQAVLTPSNTTQTSVVWSITSGGLYASINQNGLVTATNSANNSSVTIKCESAANPNIYAAKTISVSMYRLVSDGLFRNYDAYGTNSTTLQDTSGNNGPAAEFPGSLNSNTIGQNCITAPSTEPYFNSRGKSFEPMLNGLSQWTLEYVVLMTSWSQNPTSIARDLYHDVSSEHAAKHLIYMSPTTSLQNNGGIFCRTDSRSWGGVEWENSVTNIDWSVPHVIDITREPNDNEYEFKLYIDGQYLTKAQGVVSGMTSTYSQKVEYLMAENEVNASVSAERSLYALRCYSKALSAAEVAQNYSYNANRYELDSI